jgi:hypothetical protein
MIDFDVVAYAMLAVSVSISAVERLASMPLTPQWIA